MNIDDKMRALEALVNETSSAIADLTDALKASGGHDAVAQALADIEEVLKKREAPKPADMKPIADAIRMLREMPAPQVNVQVDVPSLLKDGGKLEMRIPAPPGGRDKVAYITYIPPTRK
jgi:hypothetical protein